MKLTEQELAAVLCGLRLLQETLRHVPEWVEDLGHFDDLPAPTSAEIDALCERLNTKGPPNG